MPHNDDDSDPRETAEAEVRADEAAIEDERPAENGPRTFLCGCREDDDSGAGGRFCGQHDRASRALVLLQDGIPAYVPLVDEDTVTMAAVIDTFYDPDFRRWTSRAVDEESPILAAKEILAENEPDPVMDEGCAVCGKPVVGVNGNLCSEECEMIHERLHAGQPIDVADCDGECPYL